MSLDAVQYGISMVFSRHVLISVPTFYSNSLLGIQRVSKVYYTIHRQSPTGATWD